MNWLTQACEEFVSSGSHTTKPNSSALTCLAMLNLDFTVAPATACSEHSDWFYCKFVDTRCYVLFQVIFMVTMQRSFQV